MITKQKNLLWKFVEHQNLQMNQFLIFYLSNFPDKKPEYLNAKVDFKSS